MGKYSPLFKHNILLQYTPNQRHNGFDTLARRFNITGGGSTIKYWYDRWDGTPNSLEHQRGAGRSTLLNTQEMNQYILKPIKTKNKHHRPVHYTEIHQMIKTKITKPISLSTIQRYGKEKLGIKKKRTKKCMKRECK
jgi:hypothetical protein